MNINFIMNSQYIMNSLFNLAGFRNNVNYRIHVVTGDRRGAGTDANVYIRIHDDDAVQSSIIRPNSIFKDDHERGSITSANVPVTDHIHHPFTTVEVWRDNFGNIPNLFGKISEFLFGGKKHTGSAAWYLDRVEVEHICTSCKWVFPVQRWIEADVHYNITVYDSLLPNDDPRPEFRLKELTLKRQEYKYTQKVPNGPAQIETLPSDEKFSDEYYWTFATEKAKLLLETTFTKWTTNKWDSIESLTTVYKKSLGEPECIKVWKEDWWFAAQRLQGVNPVVIQLCTAIPDKLGVTEDIVSGLIEDYTLDEAVSNKKIFMCDLEILEGIKCPDNRILACPIALFYLNQKNELMPIAIQLQQNQGPDNPVYTPKDPANMWLVAKIWYNNSEAQHHQGLTHLGYTHIMMEGVCICTHRNLSPSHPMFKLMAPHFLFLLAINSRGLEKLVNPGGWVDHCMTQGVEGIFSLMIKAFDRWDFNINSCPEYDLKHRGVYDPEILPNYPYRDDALPLHTAIKNYVTKVVNHYYDTPDKIKDDFELKMWRDELVRARNDNGVGLRGLPGTDEEGFRTVDDIVGVVSFIISTCSLGHAASNFQQYEQYGFVPNYPGLLMDNPPTEKRMYTDNDIISLIPNMEKTLEIMVITKLLSLRGTKSLGDFEMQYLYNPVDVKAAEEFRKELKKIHHELQIRDADRAWKFPHLDPKYVPNSISV